MVVISCGPCWDCGCWETDAAESKLEQFVLLLLFSPRSLLTLRWRSYGNNNDNDNDNDNADNG